MDIIKCPNCGSFAQVQLMWEDRVKYADTKTKKYKCGCGCIFEVIFKIAEINILENS